MPKNKNIKGQLSDLIDGYRKLHTKIASMEKAKKELQQSIFAIMDARNIDKFEAKTGVAAIRVFKGRRIDSGMLTIELIKSGLSERKVNGVIARSSKSWETRTVTVTEKKE